MSTSGRVLFVEPFFSAHIIEVRSSRAGTIQVHSFICYHDLPANKDANNGAVVRVMGFKAKRKVIAQSKHTKAVIIPWQVVTGDVVTMAGGHLLLVDPSGKINENELHEFYDQHVEPAFYKWLDERRKEAHAAGSTINAARSPDDLLLSR